MRRCIACYESFPQDKLARFVLIDGKVVPDFSGREKGRGAYLCKNDKCLELAMKKRAFNRTFKMDVDIDTNYEAIEELINSAKEE